MNEQSITSRFRAHDCAENTSAQNKRYIVPHILAARSPRDSDFIPGNILQEPGKHWNGYQWKNDSGDLVYENFTVEAEGQWGSNLYANGDDKPERPGNYIWRNGYIGPQMDPYNAGMLWGAREWNVPHRELIDCDFFGIPREHGIYSSLNAGSVVDRCTFVRCGSQGIQFVHRTISSPPYSPTGDNAPYKAKPLNILRDTHFIDCADGGARRSYNASYFDPGNSEFPGTLRVENCSFVAAWREPMGHWNSYSTGALVVTPMGSNPPLTSNMMELVEINNCLFDFTAPDRSVVNIRSTDTVVIEDCTFIIRDSTIGRAVTIDSPNGWVGDTKTKRIIIRNCIGVGDPRITINPRDGEGPEMRYDLHTPGKELIIDGETGAIISERRIGPEDAQAAAEDIRKAREEYFGND